MTSKTSRRAASFRSTDDCRLLVVAMIQRKKIIPPTLGIGLVSGRRGGSKDTDRLRRPVGRLALVVIIHNGHRCFTGLLQAESQPTFPLLEKIALEKCDQRPQILVPIFQLAQLLFKRSDLLPNCMSLDEFPSESHQQEHQNGHFTDQDKFGVKQTTEGCDRLAGHRA